MNLEKISLGAAPPDDVNVIVEIPLLGSPIKYEVSKGSGAMFVDRFLHTAMSYPANYGFIPHTLSEDGDPIDALVVAPYGVAVGSVIRARPIGVLQMEDENGPDEKILSVPHAKLTPIYDGINSYNDLPKILLSQIEHFFAHYKDLEKGKWVNVLGWGEADVARRMITDAIRRAEQKR